MTPSTTSKLHFLMITLMFLVGFVGLDSLCAVHPTTITGVPPWHPPAGLTLAFLLRYGLRHVPTVAVAVVLSIAVQQGGEIVWSAALKEVLVMTFAYGATTAILRAYLPIDPGLPRFSDFLRFLLAGVVATLVVAMASVAPQQWAGEPITSLLFRTTILPTWVGHFIGILTLAPALLIYTDARTHRRWQDRPLPSVAEGLEIAAQVLCILATVHFVFGFEGADEFKFFYPLFLPIIWIAVRHGLEGATAAILLTEIALIISVQSQGHEAATVSEFQMLMVALGLAGLFLGAVVSESRRVNRALQESQARLTAILDTAPDGIITIGENGDIESANPAVSRMFGRKEMELCALPITALTPDLDLHERGGGHEMTGVRGDGSQFPAEVAVGETTIGHRRLFIAIIRDVTRRAHAEAWVRRHQTELAHAYRVSMVGAMASAIAHEESQPLAAIAAYARACRLLLDAPEIDLKKIRVTLDKLAAQAARAGEILTRLREFLRRGEMHATPTGVQDITSEVAALARTDVAAHGIKLELDVQPLLPAVLADRVHIEQVLLNLVRNAVDAISESGGEFDRRIWIHARRRDASVEFLVGDTGPGIDPAIAGQLFRPFTTTKGQGMGLGLSICRTIVEAHGGQLHYAPGQAPGAAFVFDLPLADDRSLS
ncbi:two-component system, LuxR family, sensor kinase FixL [Azospirillaceae bacterium]